MEVLIIWILKKMNLTAETLFEVKQKFGTPTYIYDENQLRTS